ncbi:hypothetical protein acdb102_02730 [Acidothermaceae bacterium B102]|nr:hypothetical protein acdb102_02730 [Acidothermaceae bacterium B102]
MTNTWRALSLRGRRTGLAHGSVIVAVRAAVLLMIPMIVLIGPAATGATRAAQIACLALGVAAGLGWAAIAWHARAERATGHRFLVAAFVVMATASAACTTRHGGALIAFALIAAISAGGLSRLVDGWIVGGAAVVAIVGGAVVAGTSIGDALGYSTGVLLALLMGQTRRSYLVQAQQTALLLDQAELLRSEQTQVATLSERARIAREIHDVLAHSLGALGIQIQAARALLEEQQDTDQAVAVLTRAQRIAAEGLDETRRAVYALRTDSRPLDQEVAALAAAHRMAHSVPVHVEIRGPVRSLPPDAALALLRTAQEALVNAAKHSPGEPISLELEYGATQTRLQVSNPLVREPLPEAGLRTIHGGFGLVGMRERLLLLQGTLTASVQGGLWEVDARVPR